MYLSKADGFLNRIIKQLYEGYCQDFRREFLFVIKSD